MFQLWQGNKISTDALLLYCDLYYDREVELMRQECSRCPG
jgi:hypothetical protein